MGEKIKVVIDADFFRNITEYDRGTKLFLQVLDDLNMEPVMHEFVAETELKGNTYLQNLLDMKAISVIYYSDYLEKEDMDEYEEYFYEAFERINRFDLPERRNIYTYADQGESLGEIRSLYMARKMGYQYFMSDDADAKLLAKNFFLRKRNVKVRSLFDVLVMCKERGTKLR